MYFPSPHIFLYLTFVTFLNFLCITLSFFVRSSFMKSCDVFFPLTFCSPCITFLLSFAVHHFCYIALLIENASFTFICYFHILFVSSFSSICYSPFIPTLLSQRSSPLLVSVLSIYFHKISFHNFCAGIAFASLSIYGLFFSNYSFLNGTLSFRLFILFKRYNKYLIYVLLYFSCFDPLLSHFNSILYSCSCLFSIFLFLHLNLDPYN